jgi:hypothetical protein
VLLGDSWKVVVFAALGWFASRQQVVVGESSSHEMGSVVHMASLLLLPYPLSVITITLSKLPGELYLRATGGRRSWKGVTVNTGATLLSVAAAGFGFHALRGDDYIWRGDAHAIMAIPALLALAGLYLFVEHAVVTGAIALTSNERPLSVFRGILGDMFVPELSLIFVGIVFAVLFHFSPVLSLFVVVPMVLSVRSFESVSRLERETVEAVLKMSESIDYRDTGTYEHSKRLADFTRRLAAASGLTPEHVQDVVLASRVHDLGKIGIGNEILLKDGPLTPEERTIMEEHPKIGADILSSYSAFEGSVDIVRHHHERWDGNGYPDRLKGEQIPIGSRIISVADAFDSMTADRPYRRGMSVDDAVERLKAGMGSQFDPLVCATFIQMLIEDGMYVPPEPAPDLRIVTSEAV